MAETTRVKYIVRDLHGNEIECGSALQARLLADRWNETLTACAPHRVIERTTTIIERVIAPEGDQT